MIEIWSKPNCPFCDKAENLCIQKELEFKKYMLDVDYSREELYSLRLRYSDGESCTHRSWDDTFFTTGKRNDNHRDKKVHLTDTLRYERVVFLDK